MSEHCLCSTVLINHCIINILEFIDIFISGHPSIPSVGDSSLRWVGCSSTISAAHASSCVPVAKRHWQIVPSSSRRASQARPDARSSLTASSTSASARCRTVSCWPAAIWCATCHARTATRSSAGSTNSRLRKRSATRKVVSFSSARSSLRRRALTTASRLAAKTTTKFSTTTFFHRLMWRFWIRSCCCLLVWQLVFVYIWNWNGRCALQW